MTDAGLPKINPFDIPETSPGRPLCPWQESDHLNYYVDSIDNSQRVMDDFTSVMSDLTTLRRQGRLVLVTGDDLCGKSSMVNWCVHHALLRMKDEQWIPEPIDLTATFDGETDELDLHTRRRMVGDRLVDELLGKGLVQPTERTYLEENREHPERVFLSLPGGLNTENADSLIILLPETEIPEEVIRYSSFLRGRILLIVESRWYLEHHIRVIERKTRVPLIRLNVGKLNSGDVRRFVKDRFSKSSGRGTYPRMSDQTIDRAAGRLDTIGQLHNTLRGTFEGKLRDGTAYDKTAMVSYEDILEYLVDELTRSRGRQDRDGRGHS